MVKKGITGREIDADKYLAGIRAALYELRKQATAGLDREAVRDRITKILEGAGIDKNAPYDKEHPAEFMRTIYGAIENYAFLGWPGPAWILTRIKEIRAAGKAES